MVATVRALASVVMLIGFYVVALVQLVAALLLAVWLSSVIPGLLAAKLALPLIAASAGAVLVALWKAIRTKPQPLHGLPLGPDQAPELWGTVRELADVVGTRVPDEIRLVPEINAAVTEDTRLLGLIGGRRILYIGLPLLQAMTVDQLRSVLAHELGHYSGRHTRLGGVAYRGRLAIGGAIGRIGPRNPVGWVFRGYARLYLLVDHAASRRQELEADRASVQVAGRTAAISALRELPVLGAAWAFFHDRYVRPGWEAGYVPVDLFGGFAELLAARTDELAELRATEPDDTGSRWDTHPPISQRIAAMAAMPDNPGVADGRPARLLLADPGAVSRRLQELVVDAGDRTPLPWPEFTAAMVAAVVQREADAVYRALGRFTGVAEPNLPALLRLVEEHRLPEFAMSLFPDATRQEAVGRFASLMERLLEGAAVASGAARWRHSWSEPARLTGRDGEPLELGPIAQLAVTPQTLPEAVKRLTALGIDPAQGTVVQRRVTANGARLLGGLANVKVDGVEHDVLVLDRGLILVGNPGKSDKGAKRLEELVTSAPLAELADRHRFLPFEEFAETTVQKRVPLKAEIALHDGSRLTLHEQWASELLEKRSRDALLAALGSDD
ncbi:M48 family metallopeptidase [Micromonospora sp. HM5-17]|jgi:Zn-dependent protease with chaperone function|uniref:M48 family metallopeptidase n=1 Tax=Micromonospora sp. HM5-17 TaxID=2487710 RepID=UPI000F48B5DC|nr:M48 family metallopeptidase [Micromonospora sp. HM5-17]ROT27966.1 HtpX-like protease [Micromonospora sp. HM5-17]